MVRDDIAILRENGCIRDSGKKLEDFVEVTAYNVQVESILNNINKVDEDSKALAVIMSLAGRPQYSTTTFSNNPEWQFVLTDAEDKILCGIKENKVQFFATIEEITDCLNRSLNPYAISSYGPVISMAMSRLTATTIQNPEWNYVITDSQDKIVFGIKVDGTQVAYLSPEELWRYVFDSITFN